MAVANGRRSVVEGDGRRPVQHHPEGRLGCQTEPDTLEARPHPRVHCLSHTSHRGVVHPACRT